MTDADEPISKRLRRRTVPFALENTKNSPVAKKKVNNNEPPAKSHEVNAVKSMLDLKDDCLLKLFEHLDIESLCQMANVCKRFGPITEQAFNKCHTVFELKGFEIKISTFRRVLCKFGHLITTIDTSDAYFENNQNIDTNIIAEYAKILDVLILRDVSINCDVAKPLFSRLKHMDLGMCKFTGDNTSLFKNCPNLEVLGFEAEDPCGFVANHYPKLEGLAFDCSYPGYTSFFRLLALNPQLKHVQILQMPEDIYISSVVEHTKNVETLKISPGFMSSLPEIQTKEGFLQLSKLKKLEYLNLNAGYEIYANLVGPLADAFAKGKVPINRLELNEFSIKSKDIKSILKLKAITILLLDKVEQLSDSDLIALTEELKELENVQLYFRYNAKTSITSNGLAKMIKNAKKLDYFALVDINNLKIDKKEYENLLKAAKSRGCDKKLTIDILGKKKTCKFNVPENIQQAGNANMKIKFSAVSESDSE